MPAPATRSQKKPATGKGTGKSAKATAQHLKAAKAAKTPKTPKVGKDGKPIKRRKTLRGYIGYWVNFTSYLKTVLKQVHPDTSISQKSLKIINSSLIELGSKLVESGAQLARVHKKQTLGVKELVSALRMVMPGELAKHALSEGTKAVDKVTKAKKAAKKDDPAIQVQSVAGILFRINRVRRFMRETEGKSLRIGGNAPVFLAAVMEYVSAELLELSGNVTRDLRKQTIKPRHVNLAIMNDEELSMLFSRRIIAEGGVLPKVHMFLRNKDVAKENKGVKDFSMVDAFEFPKYIPEQRQSTKKSTGKGGKRPASKKPAGKRPAGKSPRKSPGSDSEMESAPSSPSRKSPRSSPSSPRRSPRNH